MKRLIFFAEIFFFVAMCVGVVVIIVLMAHSGNSSVLGTTAVVTPTLKTSSTQTVTPTLTPTPTESPQDTCNDLLVLVNKTYGLPADYVPPDLVRIHDYGIPVASINLQGRLILMKDLKRMVDDAKSVGVDLIVLSPYRSFETQQGVHDSYVQSDGEADADMYSALPGHSQHQLGTAIDFSTDEIGNQLEEGFGGTKAGKWMALNAYKYGFYIAYPKGSTAITGYAYEPWHYRYIGVENAGKVYDSELTLEEYLDRYGVIPKCQ